jgi:hypothetical protein
MRFRVYDESSKQKVTGKSKKYFRIMVLVYSRHDYTENNQGLNYILLIAGSA